MSMIVQPDHNAPLINLSDALTQHVLGLCLIVPIIHYALLQLPSGAQEVNV